MQTVIGLFENARDAQKAAQQLMSAGFTADNVDVSVRDGGSDSSENYSSDNYSSDDNTAGVLPGNLTSDTSTTGTSNYSSDSNYRTDTMSDDSDLSDRTRTSSSDSDRTSSGDSFGDKVSRFFKNLFGNDDDEAGRYSHVANRTGNVVTVYAQSDEEAERAADILDEYGAVDVNERAAEYGYSGTGSNYGNDTTTDRMTDTTTDRMSDTTTDKIRTGDNDKGDTLNVIKEDVQVGKKEVETGGVRLRSRIVERPVEETLRLREEKVTVERNPVDRPATNADFENFKEGEIEMTERAEVADVSKQAKVVEEVKLSKEVNERTETINETARDTEVDVENLSKNDSTRKYNKKKDL